MTKTVRQHLAYLDLVGISIVVVVLGMYAWHYRSKYQAQLEEAQMLRDLMDRCSDGLGLVEGHDGLPIYRNHAMEELTGWSRDAVLAHGGIRGYYVPPESWDVIRAAVLAGKIFDDDIHIRKPDGEIIEVHLRAFAVSDSRGTVAGILSQMKPSRCRR